MGAREPSRAWASVELAIAVLFIAAGLQGYVAFGATLWLLAIAAVLVWWRGPGWRRVGFDRPRSIAQAVAIGVAVGLGYQFLSLMLVEPTIAHITGNALPDVSIFRAVIGDERQLAMSLLLSWTTAAFAEETVYRGWITARLAELGLFSTRAWIAAIVVSSVVFGLLHMYQGLSGMIATGLTGLVLGWLYLATGRNLWAPIIAHGVMDTSGFVMIYFGLYPGV
ncbi:MAG TPA: type II CAAX endopeptidase family protein [Vicinamibacterales bacterium]